MQLNFNFKHKAILFKTFLVIFFLFSISFLSKVTVQAQVGLSGLHCVERSYAIDKVGNETDEMARARYIAENTNKRFSTQNACIQAAKARAAMMGIDWVEGEGMCNSNNECYCAKYQKTIMSGQRCSENTGSQPGTTTNPVYTRNCYRIANNACSTVEHRFQTNPSTPQLTGEYLARTFDCSSANQYTTPGQCQQALTGSTGIATRDNGQSCTTNTDCKSLNCIAANDGEFLTNPNVPGTTRICAPTAKTCYDRNDSCSSKTYYTEMCDTGKGLHASKTLCDAASNSGNNTGGGGTTTPKTGQCVAIHYCDNLFSYTDPNVLVNGKPAEFVDVCVVANPTVDTDPAKIANFSQEAAQQLANSSGKCVQYDLLTGADGSCSNGHVNGNLGNLVDAKIACPQSTPGGSTPPASTPTSRPATPTPTPAPTIRSCNSTCTSDAQCQAVDSRFSCANTADGSRRCRLASNPTSNTCQPAAGPQCLSISMNAVNNPSAPMTADPDLGDAVTFTCGQVAGANRYIFKVTEPDGNEVELSATGRTSQPYTINKDGRFFAQCQICTGAGADTCLPYEPRQ